MSDAFGGCKWCGPKCYGGAAHNARMEEGDVWGTFPGEGGAREERLRERDGVEALLREATPENTWKPAPDPVEALLREVTPPGVCLAEETVRTLWPLLEELVWRRRTA